MDAKRNDDNDKEIIIAKLRDAQVQLMLINQEQPSVNFRRAIDTLEEAIRTLQQH
ncbi:MAG TPA: hypothetical protein VNZ53_43185 [Steroidobacteraceae bacterium]|jgi:hypothetical protein|nr:hypothetical protein [Steroidobacteraceae bacterium]